MELSRRGFLFASLAASSIVGVGVGVGVDRVASFTTLIPGRSLASLAPLAWDIRLRPIATRRAGTATAVYDAVNKVGTFTYTEGSRQIEYVVDVASAALQAGVIEVVATRNGTSPITAVTGAGAYYLPLSGGELSPEALASSAATTVAASFAGQKLTIDCEDTVASVTTAKTYTFELDKQTLVIRATSASTRGRGGYSGFGTGRAESTATLTQTTAVFVEDVAVTVVDQSSFLSAYLDKAKSGGTLITNAPAAATGSATHGMRAQYELNSAAETNPLDETMYVTLSPELLDCVSLTNATKSVHRDGLDTRVIYDTWEYRPSYQERKRHYRMLRETYGIDDMMLIDHRWQRDTLDISTPAHFPASTSWGSAASFADYVATARALDWAVALHEDYWFMYPSATNQYWNVPGVEARLAQDAAGILRYGWLTTSWANKSDEMLGYAQIESTLIKDEYHSDAAFLDVNGGVDPSVMNQVTLNATSTTSRTLAQVVSDNVALFEGMKAIYDGPLMSEGAQGDRAFGSAYAGHVDATEREITGLVNGRIMPDYELRHIRPLQANQGMGYPARFDPEAVRIRYELSGAGTGTGVPNLPKVSTGAVGDHGLYYFAATGTGAGTTLAPMSRGVDGSLGGEYWYHDDDGGRRSVIAPLHYAGIGIADPGSSTYPVIGFRAPNSGWIVARLSATAYPLPGSSGYSVVMTRNGFDAASEIPMDSGDEHWVKVLRGDMIYIVFRPDGTVVNGDRCGYYAWIAYADVERTEALNPVVGTNYEICGSSAPASTVNLAQLGSGLQDDNGLQYFAATGSGAAVHLTRMRLAYDAARGGEHWVDSDGPSGAKAAPLAHGSIGVVEADGSHYPVIAFRAPNAGTVFLGFTHTEYLGSGSAGFSVQVFQNGFEAANAVAPTASGAYWVCVEKDDLLYLSFRPDGALVGGDHVGYYAYLSYSELSDTRRRGTTHSHAVPSGVVATCQNSLPAPLPSGAVLQVEPGFHFDFDRYNTMAIAYGHTGFIGEIHHGMVEQQVNCYFMFRAIQEQYLDTSVSVVLLEYVTAGGTALGLDAAVASGYDFTRSRLRIEYSNGLRLHLNFADTDWTVSAGGSSYVLDRNGYVAINTGASFRQYSCLQGGKRVDYVDCPQYTYAHPRGNTVEFGGGMVVSEMTIVHK